MEQQQEDHIRKRLQLQRHYFATGVTKDTATRLSALRRLKKAIRAYEKEVGQALWEDLHKSAYETYLTETSIVLHELDMQISNLKKWSRPEKAGTPFFLWPSKSMVIKEPYGQVLVIAPWNYPFQLIMVPLIAAVAAGNVVVLKPAHETPRTTEVIGKIIRMAFEEEYVSLFAGATELSTCLLSQRFDYIFFTGSPRVGKIVMAAAANHLTPVTLELGGKSPCLVDKGADLDIAARRITWGKLINAGQTCIAPDYLLVHRKVKGELLQRMEKYIRRFYGEDPGQSPDYPRIISPEAVDRLQALIRGEKIYCGGTTDRDSRYVAPTILDEVSPDSSVMQEEIFGPVLPVLTVEDMEEAVHFIKKHERPLALYYFGSPSMAGRVIRHTSSGGACINDTLLHIANPELPFGGIGQSGMGSYHGKAGFDTFTHRRSLLISKNSVDIGIKYPPYKKTALLKRLM